MHRNCELLFEKHAKSAFKEGMRVLEIGPDAHPSTFQKLVSVKDIKWETLDIYRRPEMGDSLTYLANHEYIWPIEDEQFDIVLSGNVIEHVQKIWVWIAEVARVCKTGGQLITINPVSWPFHGEPQDCWRIYPQGMQALYDEAGVRTTLSVYESLDFPKKYSIPYLAKQLIKPLFGREPVYPRPVIDTITIGVKEAGSAKDKR
jgi:SAM-dependent methyltransferase